MDGGNGDGVSLGGSVPGGGELGLGGLHLGGVSDVVLGEGVSGHSQGSENNLQKNPSNRLGFKCEKKFVKSFGVVNVIKN